MTQTATPLAGDIWTSYSTRDRTLLTIGSVASWWIFSSVASIFSYPQFPRFCGSLLVQPSPAVMLIMTAVVLVACTLLTSFFAGIVHFEAGLFCAAVGMTALSVRGGSMNFVLMASPGNAIFAKLIVELVLLFVFLTVAWLALGRLTNAGLLRAEPHGEDDRDVMPAQGALALGAQVVLMIVFMLILAQTDKKAQAVWSVAISAWLAAMAAHSLFPSRPSAWFWIAPLIVGVIGYALAWSGGNGLPGGAVGGMLPQLGRPVPLDYASVGVAGTLLGYWTSRRWQHERDHDPEAPGEEDALNRSAGNV